MRAALAALLVGCGLSSGGLGDSEGDGATDTEQDVAESEVRPDADDGGPTDADADSDGDGDGDGDVSAPDEESSGEVEAVDVTDEVADVPDVTDVLDLEEAGEEVGDEVADGEADTPTGCEPFSCPDGMVYVPCGPFLMGSQPTDPWAASDQMPQHVVTLAAYCVDVTEVEAGAYAACGWCSTATCTASAPDHPATCVTWYGAADYCAARGARLPTEAEWEKAARGGCDVVPPEGCDGSDARTWPWGTSGGCTDVCDCMNNRGCVGAPVVVGSYPLGASPYGVLDMAGNVREWTADWYATDAYGACAAPCENPQGPTTGEYKVLRGEAWDGIFTEIPRRFVASPSVGDSHIGFRCAWSP